MNLSLFLLLEGITVVISTQSTWEFLFCSLNEVMLTKALNSRICNTCLLWSILLWFQTLYTGFKRKILSCFANFLFYVFIQKYNYVELMGPLDFQGISKQCKQLTEQALCNGNGSYFLIKIYEDHTSWCLIFFRKTMAWRDHCDHFKPWGGWVITDHEFLMSCKHE